MNLNIYAIKHFNNTLDLFDSKEKLYSSSWFMEFGKLGCEVFNQDKKIIYSMYKQFQFWKWRMVYKIKKDNILLSELISQNNKKTIYSIDIEEITYEIQIHYRNKKSIYKNGNKIAEFNEACVSEEFKDKIKLLLLDKKDLEICFLLFSCLKIGETERTSNSILTSQKQLEVNDEPWT